MAFLSTKMKSHIYTYMYKNSFRMSKMTYTWLKARVKFLSVKWLPLFDKVIARLWLSFNQFIHCLHYWRKTIPSSGLYTVCITGERPFLLAVYAPFALVEKDHSFKRYIQRLHYWRKTIASSGLYAVCITGERPFLLAVYTPFALVEKDHSFKRYIHSLNPGTNHASDSEV